MPGAQNPNSNSEGNGSGNSSGTPTINGVRQLDTMVTMDGMTVMSNVGDEGGTPVQPGEESVQEMHSVLANAPAEFWRPAAITVVTKSGTNQFHGSLFEDNNTNATNSKSFFATTIPFRVENNFAASVGGPIKKDKLFFFAAYEGGRNAQDNVVVGNVPLPSWTTGNFSSLGQPIINPYTGHPFPHNTIPTGMISPVSKTLEATLFPAPNYGPAGLLSGNYRQLIPTAGSGWTDFNNGDATIDSVLSKSDTLFFRDTYRELPVLSFDGSLPSVGTFVEERLGNSGVISENHIFSPNLMNELRLGYTDMKLSYHQTFNGYNLITKAGMQGPFPTFNPPIPGVPSISITSISGTSGLLPDQIDNDEDYEWNDNVSWTRGKHLLKFGVDQILDHFRGVSNYGTIYGNYNFNGLFTGNGYADFLLGLPQQTSVNTPSPIAQLHGVLLGMYAQDQFQVNQRLTINYGLRWEYQGPYSGAPNLLYSFDPKNGKEVIPTQAGLSHLSPYFPKGVVPVETAADAGYPSGSLMFGHYLDFYPRAGFAYRLFPNRGTVLRGAYGLYGNNVYAALGIGQLSSGGPFTGSATFFNKMVNGRPLFSFPKPFLTAGTLSTQTATAPDPHLTVPYTQQWNLTVEQPLGTEGVITLAYVGAASRNLLESLNLDQPPPSKIPFSTAKLAYPNYSAVNWIQNGGVDNYNSLQISVRTNQGKHLYIDTGLTVAKDLTDDEDLGYAYGQAPENRFCLGCEYGHNGLTRRLDYYLNANWMLPFGQGKAFFGQANRWTNRVIGGWDFAADSSMMSGRFFSPYINSGFDTANTNTSFLQRPDQIGNPRVAHPSIRNWYNVKAFAIPGCPVSDPLCLTSTPIDVGRFGNVKPRGLVGPNYVDFDLSLMRDFRLASRGIFQFRVTAQNALNHPNFAIPDPHVTDGPGVAGVITSLAGANLGAREIDFVGRFQF